MKKFKMNVSNISQAESFVPLKQTPTVDEKKTGIFRKYDEKGLLEIWKKIIDQTKQKEAPITAEWICQEVEEYIKRQSSPQKPSKKFSDRENSKKMPETPNQNSNQNIPTTTPLPSKEHQSRKRKEI